MRSSTSKEQFVNYSSHICEFILNLMVSIRNNEEEHGISSTQMTLAMYYKALFPYEKFLIELNFFDDEEYKEIFYYSEAASIRYPYPCTCKFCAN